jgi:hypothetical protein
MEKEIKIVVPTQWSAITLKKWLELQKDLKTYADEETAYIACILHHLCDVEPQWITQLETDTLLNIKADLFSFMGKNDLPLQRIINIDGVEYGFEPNLSRMAYGAYLDIIKWDNIQIDENWHKIMNILYRPIVKKANNLYDIEPYTGGGGEEKFLNVGMDVHWGTLFFFVHLLEDLQNATLNYLMQSEELPPNIKSILQRSGEIIKRSYNLLEEISEQ